MLDATEKDLGKVFAGAGKNPLAELAFKIISRLEEAPNHRLMQKQLLAVMFEDGDIDEQNKALDFLVRTDQIVQGTLNSFPCYTLKKSATPDPLIPQQL